MTFPTGFRHMPEFLLPIQQVELVNTLYTILEEAPFFTPAMPKTGRPFSVKMSNCGSLGWVSDKAGGYRYQETHPETGEPWPPLPEKLLDLWNMLSGYPHAPEACLINWYRPGAKMGVHRDQDEEDFNAPVVSVSLGDSAIFRIGGKKRHDATQSLELKSGDIVVLGGDARDVYHGIARTLPGTSELLKFGGRINLTLRRVHAPA